MIEIRLHRFALYREPESVVNQFTVFDRHRVAGVQHFAVECERFDRATGVIQKRAARSFVDPSRFHADEAVLNQINHADPVPSGDFVGSLEQCCRFEFLAVDGDWVATDEFDLNVFGCVWRVLERVGQFEHVCWWFGPRVLEDAALVGDVQQVRVGAVRFFGGDGYGNVVFFGEGHQFFAARRSPFAPGCNHFDFWVERVGGNLEAHLIVAFSGRAVADRARIFLEGNVDKVLGDQWSGDARAQKVIAFV